MKLTELQRLRLNLQIQERELAALLREPTPNQNSIEITKQAIQDWSAKLSLFPPEPVARA